MKIKQLEIDPLKHFILFIASRRSSARQIKCNYGENIKKTSLFALL